LREVQERLGHANVSTTHMYRQSPAEATNEVIIDGRKITK
jgi:site-specific recombinase XerC